MVMTYLAFWVWHFCNETSIPCTPGWRQPLPIFLPISLWLSRNHLTNSVNSAFQSPLQSTPSNCAEQKACLSGLESKKPRLTGRTMQGVLKLPAWIGAAAKCGACINLCTLLLPWQKQGIVLSYWGHLVPAFCRRAHTSHTASKLGHGSLQRFPLKHVAI